MELKSIMTNDFKHCFLCGKESQQIHHVIGGAYRKKAEKYGLLVPLCMLCHGKVHDEPSQETNKELKKIGQADFMMHYSYAEWMKQFGKNYM